MSWWQGLILGLVQGLTEFLPVSSSGHLVVAEAAVGLHVPGLLVEVALHVATLLAVVIVYWTTLWRLAYGMFRGDRPSWRYVGLLLLASVPAGVVGLMFRDLFERAFESLLLVGVDFVITGLILWSTRRVSAGRGDDGVPVRAAVAMGIAQAFAIFPGISRSGSTVSAGLWTGVDPVRAAEFSFLMAIPVILGAAVLQLPDAATEAAALGVGPIAVAFVAALVSGVAAIKLLVLLLRRRAFYRFAPYCWLLGSVTILWGLWR